MNLEFPILDGVTPSWADIQVKCTLYPGMPLTMADIKALDTGGAVDIGEQRSGGRMISRGTGSVSYTGSITLYRSGYNKFLRFAAKVAPKRNGQSLLTHVPFDLTVSHTPPVQTIEIYQFVCKGLRISGFSMNGAEGSDLDTVELPLSVGQIIHVIDGQEVVLG